MATANRPHVRPRAHRRGPAPGTGMPPAAGMPAPAATGSRTAVGPAPGRLAFGLSWALVVVAALAGGLTFFGDGVLGGPAVSQGSARGTALVALVVAAPMLATALVMAARGSTRAVVVWLAAVGYLLYNAQLFLYATPYNRLFLLYVGLLGLSFWSGLAVLTRTDVAAFAARFGARLPHRGIAVYVGVVTVVNALLWLRTIVPATFGDDPTGHLAGTGMTTNPVFVQDLAAWLPLMGVAAWWLWRRRPWGLLVCSVVLTMWVVEGVGIATDQWFGHQADPASALADAAMVPAFAVLAAVGLVPVALLLHHLHDDGPAGD